MPYIDNAERAQENRSSAWALLIAGSICLIVVILGMVGILPFKLSNPYLMYGVMAVFSLVFLIMGFVSLKSAKSYSKQAESEKFLHETVLEWCRENLRKEDINAEVEDYSETPEEVIYFRRVECIKNKINHQFMNLDQNFVDRFIDENIYDMIFGQHS